MQNLETIAGMTIELVLNRIAFLGFRQVDYILIYKLLMPRDDLYSAFAFGN